MPLQSPMAKYQGMTLEYQEDANAAKVTSALSGGPQLPAKAPVPPRKAGGAVAETAPPPALSKSAKASSDRAAKVAQMRADASASAAEAEEAEADADAEAEDAEEDEQPLPGAQALQEQLITMGHLRATMTSKQKAKSPCMHLFGLRTCRFENDCHYSHGTPPPPPPKAPKKQGGSSTEKGKGREGHGGCCNAPQRRVVGIHCGNH